MQIVYTSTHFKAVVYRSVLAIVLGAVLLLWPGVALKYVIMTLGVFFLASGLIALVSSVGRREDRRKSLVPFSGVGSMVLGLFLLAWPATFVSIVMFFLGFLLVLAAVAQFVTLSAARRFGYGNIFNYVFPVLIFVTGILVLVDPFKSTETVFVIFGIASMVYGVTDLVNQYSIRRMRKAYEKEERTADGTLVEDVEYEEVDEEEVKEEK